MSRRRWPRWRRRAAAGIGGSAVVALSWFGAPFALRQVPLFRVRQIELVGVRNLTPDAVIAALRLSPHASVFGDTRLLADRVRGLAGVADARVVRRLPAALLVEVREVEPAALTPARGGLVPVDAAGRPLPFDPARSGLDLPIAAAGDSGVGVAGVLALIQSVDPALFQTIAGARAVTRGAGGVLLEIGSHRVVVGRDAGPEVIRAVVLVAQDLAAKGRAYGELDARFGGQVIVRRRPAGGSGGA